MAESDVVTMTEEGGDITPTEVEGEKRNQENPVRLPLISEIMIDQLVLQTLMKMKRINGALAFRLIFASEFLLNHNSGHLM